MSLTPLKSDPNYEAEILRKEKDPASFGEDAPYEEIMAKLAPGIPGAEHGGLIPNFAEYEAGVAKGEPAPTPEQVAAMKAQEDLEAYGAKLAEWAAAVVNGGTVADVVAILPDCTPDHVAALITAETAGQGRKKLLDALDAAIKTGDK